MRGFLIAAISACLLAVALAAASSVVSPTAVVGASLVVALALPCVWWPRYALMLLATTIPLEMLPAASFVEMRAVRFIFLGAATAALVLHRRHRLPPRAADGRFLWPMTLLVVAGALSSLMAQNPGRSILGAAQVAVLFLFFWSLLKYGDWITGEFLQLAAATVVGVGVAEAALALAQCVFGYVSWLGMSASERLLYQQGAYSAGVGGLTRSSGTLNNPNAAGIFFAMAFATAFIRAQKKSRSKGLFTAASIILFGGLVSTFSRGAIFSAIATLALLSLVSPDWQLRRYVLAAAGAGGMLLLLLFSRAFVTDASAFLRLDGHGLAVPTSRIHAWEQGWSVIQRSPWLGVGYYEFISADTGNTEGLIRSLGDTKDIHTPHNGWLQEYVESGLLGGLCYLGLYIALVAYALQLLRTTRLSQGTGWARAAVAAMILVCCGCDLFDAGAVVGAAAVPCLLYLMLGLQISSSAPESERARRHRVPPGRVLAAASARPARG